MADALLRCSDCNVHTRSLEGGRCWDCAHPEEQTYERALMEMSDHLRLGLHTEDDLLIGRTGNGKEFMMCWQDARKYALALFDWSLAQQSEQEGM